MYANFETHKYLTTHDHINTQLFAYPGGFNI
jgi:hypothetical protein